MKTSSRTRDYRFTELKKSLKVDEDILKILTNTRELDDETIEYLLKEEGKSIAYDNFIYNMENKFLEELDYEDILLYIDIPSNKWDFLRPLQIKLLNNTLKLYKKLKLDFLLNKAELMILRKEVINFVEERLKHLKSEERPEDIINHIINNYTYEDTLLNLGFIKKDDELFKLKLSKQLEYIL